MNYKDVKPLADFDWEAIDEKAGKINVQKASEKDEQYDKSFNSFTEQEVIEGIPMVLLFPHPMVTLSTVMSLAVALVRIHISQVSGIVRQAM